MQWFNVHKEGLAQIMERKGKAFIALELLQNAWDEESTQVEITLERIPGTRFVRLCVIDNNPEGFADLTHAFTLFAESNKKGNAEKRGRFNLGEKLVLAMCREATITTTKGTIHFGPEGRKQTSKKRATGTEFVGEIRMKDEEIEECKTKIFQLLPPKHIDTFFNGELLKSKPEPFQTTIQPLPTEISDAEGNLRRTVRNTWIEIYEADGQQAWLYEMGIPVVEVEGPYHINVMQKVPLNFDRDNVPVSFIAKVQAYVLEYTRERLSEDQANERWVKTSVEEHPELLSNDTIKTIADLRLGEKRVAFDPSDLEANSRAIANGYRVIHGSQLSKGEWSTLKRADAILPAGRVTPSPKPFDDEGKPLKYLPLDEWGPEVDNFVQYVKRLAEKLIPLDKNGLEVSIVNQATWGFAGTYGKTGPRSGHLNVNFGRLGRKWFKPDNREAQHAFIIHEFGHHFSLDHFSAAYHDALCRLGAKLVTVAVEAEREAHSWAA